MQVLLMTKNLTNFHLKYHFSRIKNMIFVFLTFQGQVYKDRKAKGIVPYLPEVEERAKIKEDFMKAVRSSIQESQK